MAKHVTHLIFTNLPCARHWPELKGYSCEQARSNTVLKLHIPVTLSREKYQGIQQTNIDNAEGKQEFK